MSLPLLGHDYGLVFNDGLLDLLARKTLEAAPLAGGADPLFDFLVLLNAQNLIERTVHLAHREGVSGGLTTVRTSDGCGPGGYCSHQPLVIDSALGSVGGRPLHVCIGHICS